MSELVDGIDSVHYRRLDKWMSVEHQVTILYAVTNGHLDDVPVAKIREWERGFHDYLDTQFPQIGQGIRKERALSKEIEADLKRAVTQYKEIAGQGNTGAATRSPVAATK